MAQAKGAEFIVNFRLNRRAIGQKDFNLGRGYLDKEKTGNCRTIGKIN